MWRRIILVVAVLVAVVGWWLLYLLTSTTLPEQPAVLGLFFALLFLTLTATLIPIVAYLNHRFAPEATNRAPFRFLRHSVWAGLCLSSCAWLQMHRAFNLGFVFIIVLIFVAIELFLVRMRGES
jgi:hypothetical protein